MESQWVNYKQSFSKEYATEAEESRRFAIWAANLDMVETHNQEAAAGVHSYTMAVNQFSDLSYEEFEKTMLGYQDDEAVDSFQFFQEKETPEAIDYRDEGLVTEVKNQGHCGSCWAFSATGGFEGVWAKQVNELISVSEQQLLDCGPGSCQGGNMGKPGTQPQMESCVKRIISMSMRKRIVDMMRIRLCPMSLVIDRFLMMRNSLSLPWQRLVTQSQ